MSILFLVLLIAHVITGVIGTASSYAVVLALLRREVSISGFRNASLIAFLSYMISWFTGGYYYWFHYGSTVKPIIKGGAYPWAHTIVMEAKEHIFLLLPILTFVITLIAFFMTERLKTDTLFKSQVTLLAVTTLVLAVLITLAGVIISGGAQ